MALKFENIINKINPWHFLWVGIILSELFTLGMNTILSLLWWGNISKDLLLIGTIDAFIVAFLVSIIIIYFLNKIKAKQVVNERLSQEISERKQVEGKLLQLHEELEDRVEDRTLELQREIVERIRAEKEAAEASQAKSEFLANMSHELRTPLNAILGFAQIMERHKRDSSDEVALRIIRRSGNHLLTLINQILDLSKIEAGQGKIEETRFDLLSLLDELKSILMLKATEKGISLVFDIQNEVPRQISTDEVKLKQILLNLLNNAIKFTNEGHVILRISMQGEASQKGVAHADVKQFLKFEIEDTGVGIAQLDRQKIFKAFAQLSNGQKIQEGTGLGLVISKKFIELLDGQLSLTSEPGKGSTFSFDIPVHVVAKDEMKHPLSTSRVKGLKPGQPSFRILIADDEPDNQQLLVRLLEPIGFELREAENGQEALTFVEEWQPHLVLMDIRMPVMDGIEATRKIRSLKSLDQQPVIIAVTANVLQPNLDSLSSQGCDDILTKPFKENDLFSLLKKHLDIHFIYESEKGFNEKKQVDPDMENFSLSPVDFKSLPREIFNELEQSITTLRMEKALSIIKEIREHNELLANALQKLVLECRFDTLQELTEKYAQQQSHE